VALLGKQIGACEFAGMAVIAPGRLAIDDRLLALFRSHLFPDVADE
jgi:hypothetical protein